MTPAISGYQLSPDFQAFLLKLQIFKWAIWGVPVQLSLQTSHGAKVSWDSKMVAVQSHWILQQTTLKEQHWSLLKLSLIEDLREVGKNKIVVFSLPLSNSTTWNIYLFSPNFFSNVVLALLLWHRRCGGNAQMSWESWASTAQEQVADCLCWGPTINREMYVFLVQRDFYISLIFSFRLTKL